jgi:hypothetical protein
MAFPARPVTPGTGTGTYSDKVPKKTGCHDVAQWSHQGVQSLAVLGSHC